MTSTQPSFDSFLAHTPPFDRLEAATLSAIAAQMQQLRYRMGQAIVLRETLPAQIIILYSGQARRLGYSPLSPLPDTLERLNPGAILGWNSLIRGIPCETVIASTAAIGLAFSAKEFRALLQQHPTFAQAFHTQVSLSELYDLISAEIHRRAIGEADLTTLTQQAMNHAIALHLPQGKHPTDTLDPQLLWWVSSGTTTVEIGSRIDGDFIQVESESARLIGSARSLFKREILPSDAGSDIQLSSDPADIPYAPDRPPELEEDETPKQKTKYPHVSGRGPVDGALACFQMLSQLWGLPFRKDVLKRALVQQLQRTETISLQFCGAIAELMGLTAQLATVPANAMCRVQTPILIGWQDSFAILYKATEKELVIAIPEQGIRRMKPESFADLWDEEGEILLLQPTKETPKRKFGLHWFIPSVIRHRRVLIEVLIASFAVQLFGLANPLLTQTIIDKVIVQNSADTLNILGSLLIGMAVVEGILTALRTNLFVDTTNRIDMTLGSEVIDHLLRLPLKYFEKRPVGELSTRIGELENLSTGQKFETRTEQDF